MDRQKKQEAMKLVDRFSIISIYLIISIWGLLQLLSFFANIDIFITGPMFILISSYMFIMSNQFYNLRFKEEKLLNKNFLYFIFIFISGFVLHLIGVNTGYIFGSYSYSGILGPNIAGVPIVMGAIWYISILSSASLIQKFSKINHRLLSNQVKSLIVGFLVMYFDILFEQVAVILNYWHWQITIPPFQNYIAWFVFGYIFALIGYKSDILNNSLPKFIIHSYLALMIGFVIIYLK